MKNTRTRKMVSVAMMSAISYVLMLFAFPIIPGFTFLKVDFSDIPVFINMFLYGPLAGIATAFLKCLLHFLTKDPSIIGAIGATASFLSTVLFVLPVYYFFKKDFGKGKQKYRNMFLGILLGICALTIFMCFANYTVLLPAYAKFAGFTLPMSMLKVVLVSVLPFNIIKGILVSIVFVIIYFSLLNWLKRQLT